MRKQEKAENLMKVNIYNVLTEVEKEIIPSSIA
jgi:hypothetical protein